MKLSTARHTLSDTVGRAKATCCNHHLCNHVAMKPRGRCDGREGEVDFQLARAFESLRLSNSNAGLSTRTARLKQCWELSVVLLCNFPHSYIMAEWTAKARRDTLRQDFFVEETECDILDSRPFDVPLPAVSIGSERVALQHDMHHCMKPKCWQRWWWTRSMELPTSAAWSMHVCALEAKNKKLLKVWSHFAIVNKLYNHYNHPQYQNLLYQNFSSKWNWIPSLLER